jgi:hypothetical protein
MYGHPTQDVAACLILTRSLQLQKEFVRSSVTAFANTVTDFGFRY